MTDKQEISSTTKRCPFCAEEIQLEAIKCRFCGEFLEGKKQDSATATKGPEVKRHPFARGCGNVLGVVFICLLLLVIFGLITGKHQDPARIGVPKEYAADVATHGPYPRWSSWDGTVYCVNDYLKGTLKDPKSLIYEKWSRPAPTEYIDKKCWMVKATYRAKNGFGGYNKVSKHFFVRDDKIIGEQEALP